MQHKKLFWPKNHFDPKIILNLKNCWIQNFSRSKFFWTQQFLWSLTLKIQVCFIEIFLLDQNSFRIKLFVLKIFPVFKGEWWGTEKNCMKQEHDNMRWSAKLFSYFTILINCKLHCDSCGLSSRLLFWELNVAVRGIDFGCFGY